MSDLLHNVNKFIQDTKYVIETDKVVCGSNELTKFGMNVNNTVINNLQFVASANKLSVGKKANDFDIDNNFHIIVDADVIDDNNEKVDCVVSVITDEVRSSTSPFDIVKPATAIKSIIIEKSDTALTIKSITLNTIKFNDTDIEFTSGSTKFNFIKPSTLVATITTTANVDYVINCNGSVVKQDSTGGKQATWSAGNGVSITRLQNISQIEIEPTVDNNDKTNTSVPTVAKVEKMISGLTDNVDDSLKIYEKIVSDLDEGIAYAEFYNIADETETLISRAFLFPSADYHFFSAVWNKRNDIEKINKIRIFGLVYDTAQKYIVNGVEVATESETITISTSTYTARSITIANTDSITLHIKCDSKINFDKVNKTPISATRYNFVGNYKDNFIYATTSAGVRSVYAFNNDSLTLQMTRNDMTKFIGSLDDKVIALYVDRSTYKNITIKTSTGETKTITTNYADASLNDTACVCCGISENQLYIMYNDTLTNADSVIDNETVSKNVVYMVIYDIELNEICRYETKNDMYGIYLGDRGFAVNNDGVIAYVNKNNTDITIDDVRTYVIKNGVMNNICYDSEGNLFAFNYFTIYDRHFRPVYYDENYLKDCSFEQFTSIGPYIITTTETKHKEYEYRPITSSTISNDLPITDKMIGYYDY